MRKLALIFLTVTAISCTQTGDVEHKTVEDVVNGILLADNHRDIDMVLSYYDEDAVLMPAGKPEIRGEQAIRMNYQKIFETSQLNLHAEIETIEVAGPLAMCKGRTKGIVTSTSDSTKVEIDDKFLMILARKNQEWKITHLMWSKDN